MPLTQIFTDDFNDNDYTPLWTLDGDPIFTEIGGEMVVSAFTQTGYLEVTGLTVESGKIYRVDFDLSANGLSPVADLSILIGGARGGSGDINLDNLAVGFYLRNVTAPDNGKIRLYMTASSGNFSLNSLTVYEEQFAAISI